MSRARSMASYSAGAWALAIGLAVLELIPILLLSRTRPLGVGRLGNRYAGTSIGHLSRAVAGTSKPPLAKPGGGHSFPPPGRRHFVKEIS